MDKDNNQPKKFFTKKKIFFIGLVVLIIVGLITRGLGLFNKKVTSTYELKKGLIKEEIVISGEVKAEKYAAMNFGISGKLAWVGVKEGQKVYKDQALVKLDTKVLNSAFEEAKSTLRSAEANVQYILDTVKNHSSDETYYQKTTRTTAEATKDSAYEAYKIAEENLRNATLYAPFAGIVSQITKTSPGVNIMYTETAVEVVDPETIYFEVYADQTEITKLNENLEVNLILDSYPDEVFKGKIEYLGLTPQSIDGGSSYKIKITFSEKPDIQKIRIGMTGDARFILKEKDDVFSVPIKYLNSDQKGKYILINNFNNKVYIETGIEGEENIEIVGNIKEGDKLLN